MPRIIGDLQGMNLYAWPFTAYMLCSTISTIIFGKISDTHGRKPIFLTGIIIFLAGSILCGLSQSMLELIIFRGIQGIGGGMLIAIAFTIVGDLFSIRERGKYSGILSAMFGLASLIGPAVGGFITDNLSWRWVFYVNIPLGIAAILMIVTVLPHYNRSEEKKSIDYRGAALLTLALAPFILAFAWAGNTYPWFSVQIIGMFVLAIILFIIFVWVERKAAEPILPLGIFKNSVLVISIVVAFLTNAVLFCGTVYIPLFMQGVVGTSATSSGFILTPAMVGLSISSIIAGQLVSKTGRYKIWALIGIAIIFAGAYLLHTMTVKTSAPQALAYSAITGIGCGMMYPIFNVAAQNVFPRNQLGLVTSTLQFFRNMGATIGTAVFGSIMLSGMNHGLAGMDLSKVPPQIAGQMGNPRFLTSPEAMNQIASQVPPSSLPMFNQILEQIKGVLANSLDMVFLTGAVFAALALIITFFIKEVPLVSQDAKPAVERGNETVNIARDNS